MNDANDAYIQKMKAKLEAWDAEIAKFEAKQPNGDEQSDDRDRIGTLKIELESIEDDLEKLQHAEVSAWEALRASVDDAARSLKDAIRTVKSRR